MLAEVLNFPLDSLDVREKAWLELKENNKEYKWIGRDYLQYDFFTDYFKSLIDKVHELFGQSKNICVQNRQIGHPKVAETSHIIHQDSYRNSCVVIAFSTITDPVCFFKKDYNTFNNNASFSPVLMSFYSQSFAVLMNTQSPHNVMVLDKTQPRVLLQVNYDLYFNDLYDPNYMRIIEKVDKKKLK